MMIQQGYRLYVENQAFKRHWVNFYLGEYDDAGQFCGVQLIRDAEPLDVIHRIPKPTFQLSPQDAQTVMDELWNAGFRPTQGQQSEGVTAAQAKHLDDMRQIAFAKLNVEKP